MFPTSRKGQNLSVQTLIVVALGILVLVTSIMIYNNVTDGSKETIGACDNLGGACETPLNGGCPGDSLHNALGDKACDAETTGNICCI